MKRQGQEERGGEEKPIKLVHCSPCQPKKGIESENVDEATRKVDRCPAIVVKGSNPGWKGREAQGGSGSKKIEKDREMIQRRQNTVEEEETPVHANSTAGGGRSKLMVEIPEVAEVNHPARPLDREGRPE